MDPNSPGMAAGMAGGGGGRGGRMMGGRGRPGRPQNTVQLVQKPTRVFQLKLKVTLRDLKRRGFDLYERCKKESGRMLDEIHVMA